VYFLAPLADFHVSLIPFDVLAALTDVGFLSLAAEAEAAPTVSIEAAIMAAIAVLIIFTDFFIVILLLKLSNILFILALNKALFQLLKLPKNN
jgi:hypothetical protein